LAKRLVFQIQEQAISEYLEESRFFINLIHKVDSQVSLECETQTNAMDLTEKMKLLSIDMVRVNSLGGQPHNISKKSDDFIKTLVADAHKFNAPVIVGHVESKQGDSLSQLGVDAGQGYLFGQLVAS
jgi:EAL domain-containing protein (putative c-di-GMP-specific phosphodiesterase class I)